MTSTRARAHTIVFGNEKGGTGKTTTAMHIAVSLLAPEFHRSPPSISTAGNKAFARYIENRRAFVGPRRTRAAGARMHRSSQRAKPAADAGAPEASRLSEILVQAKANSDFIIIDTPGNDTELSRLGHSAADTLVTPINDSFLDFDLLAKCDPENLEIGSPSLYAEFVWDCRKRRLMASRDNANIDWVVMRNRVSSSKRATSAKWPPPSSGSPPASAAASRRPFGARDLPRVVSARADRA